MTRDTLRLTARFSPVPTQLPQSANASLPRIAPASRQIRGRVAVCWTVSLGRPRRHPGLHARSA